jgi:gamma-glutamyltranspeptidase/glutathione hydrolase
MANSIELIARTKGEAFYRGELAEKIAAYAKQHDAALSLDDLDRHRLDWCGTASVGFQDVQLHEIPPNGQGISALMALGILSNTDVARYEPDSAEALHLQIEAMKIAFADANRYVSDPDHMPFSVEELISADYLKGRAQEINPDRAGTPHARAPRDSGTVYVTAADDSGMMVSYIQSNFNGFGSGVVIPGTGISMQNRGLSFVTEAGHPNRVGPRKRPFHTIIPGFVMRGDQPLMSFGVMGGPMQSQGHVQMLLRTQLWKQNPQLASDAPRWRVLDGLKVAVESTMNESAIEGLKARGHIIQPERVDTAFGFGGAQLIQRIEGGYIAGSDHRKDGFAVGF